MSVKTKNVGPPTEEQKAIWREAFDIFDKNKDGHIELNELSNVIRSMGCNPTDKELKDMFDMVDADANGMLEFDDFQRLMAHNVSICLSQQEHERELYDAFRIFDKDGSGFIEKKELIAVLTAIGEPLSADEVKSMIEVVDSNNDGKIDYSEFVAFINKPVLSSSTMGQ